MAFNGLIETPIYYFLGTDWVFDFTVYTTAQKTAIRDVSGYATNFMVKRFESDPDASALITATGTVSGSFNASPALNTQKISVTLVDTDTDTEITPGMASWELKRIDAGAEAVLAYGTMELRRAIHIT